MVRLGPFANPIEGRIFGGFYNGHILAVFERSGTDRFLLISTCGGLVFINTCGGCCASETDKCCRDAQIIRDVRNGVWVFGAAKNPISDRNSLAETPE